MEWFSSHRRARSSRPSRYTRRRQGKSGQKPRMGISSQEGVQGKAPEFSFPVFRRGKPPCCAKSGKVKVGGMTLDPAQAPGTALLQKSSSGANWSKANDKAHAKAKDRLKAVQAVHALVANGSTMMEAYQHISAEFAIALPTLRRYCAAVKRFDDCDWLAVLVPKQQQAATESRAARLAPSAIKPGSSSRPTTCRREQPNASVCYERLKLAARDQAWAVPAWSSLMRRLELEVPQAPAGDVAPGRARADAALPAAGRAPSKGWMP